MVGRYWRANLIPYLVAFSTLGCAAAFAESPTAEVKATVDQVVKIVTDPRYSRETRKEERRQLLREAIVRHLDFQEMARRSLGPEWNRRSPEEQREFIKLFSDFLEMTYVRKIESYSDEKFVYTGESIEEPYAEVDSKILASNGDKITISYMLHRVNNEWKAYDLIIDDVSLVNNYRAQFNRVIAKSSFEELLSRIRQKLNELAEK